MIHLGDITKIKGNEVPLVDVITYGAPCQDLSVAGKRAGMKNVIMGDEDSTRSGLFFDAIRVVKEMRNESKRQLSMRGSAFDIRHIQPRYTVYENVPGAFSSNDGEDFRAVLEETCKVADENAHIPRLEKGQRWTNAGCIMGDGYSVAWRLHDARYHGVPQRRRRLCVLADYGGATAPEILFELIGETTDSETFKTVTDIRKTSEPEVQPISKSVSGGIKKSRETREEIAGDIENSITTAISFQERAGKPGGGKGILIQNEHTGALSTLNNQSVVYSMGHDIRSARFTDDEVVDPLTATDYKDPIKIAYEFEQTNGIGIVGSLVQDDYKGVKNEYAEQGKIIVRGSIARKITPLECERLQGYPDEWTNIGDWIDSNGKLHKGNQDTPRYKALGNSIALPFWAWLAGKIAKQLEKDGTENPTMASLFDGIGGFPLVFKRVGVEPIWASEIEEFPIAVTAKHFGENGDIEKYL